MKGSAIGNGHPLRTAQALQQLISGIHKIVLICLDSVTGALKSDGGRIHLDCLGKESLCVRQTVKCLLLSSFSLWTSKLWCKEVPQHSPVGACSMSATEPRSACLEFCFPTISGSPDVQTSSGELPLAQIKGPGNSALPFLQDGKEKAEPKVTQSLSPVFTVGMLRGGRQRWGRNLGEIGSAVGNSCQGNRAAVLCTPPQQAASLFGAPGSGTPQNHSTRFMLQPSRSVAL